LPKAADERASRHHPAGTVARTDGRALGKLHEHALIAREENQAEDERLRAITTVLDETVKPAVAYHLATILRPTPPAA